MRVGEKHEELHERARHCRKIRSAVGRTLRARTRAILDALAGLHVEIEHVGSTSVRGLAAKPILDVMIIVESAEDAIRAITPLVGLDYICRGEAEVPGRIFFRRGVTAVTPCASVSAVAIPKLSGIYCFGIT